MVTLLLSIISFSLFIFISDLWLLSHHDYSRQLIVIQELHSFCCGVWLNVSRLGWALLRARLVNHGVVGFTGLYWFCTQAPCDVRATWWSVGRKPVTRCGEGTVSRHMWPLNCFVQSRACYKAKGKKVEKKENEKETSYSSLFNFLSLSSINPIMASNKIKIGQYNVLQTLGVGSFGKVKRMNSALEKCLVVPIFFAHAPRHTKIMPDAPFLTITQKLPFTRLRGTRSRSKLLTARKSRTLTWPVVSSARSSTWSC